MNALSGTCVVGVLCVCPNWTQCLCMCVRGCGCGLSGTYVCDA